MNKIILGIACLALTVNVSAQTMRETIGKHFLIGAAVSTRNIYSQDPKVKSAIVNNFNAIVPENCMKGEAIHPEENRYSWDDADATVKYAEDNHMTVTGHCLVWHSQAPRWMFKDSEGKTVTREVLIDRLYHHITNVVGRYKGRIKGWDVVNEAFEDDGSYRKTQYYNIIGPEYFELAFKFAHEADPNAELYYNDYSMSKPAKRDAVCRLVRDLKAKGCRIDAVGMQSHNGTDYPNLNDYEASIDSFAACGVKVMMTELDINMLPSPQHFGGADISQRFKYDKTLNPYVNGLTKSAQKLFNERYLAFFKIYAKHKDQISRVTLWGVSDADSWLNGWPVPGRTNYSLLIDRQYNVKPVVKDIIKLFK